jgi:hypothetical protein
MKEKIWIRQCTICNKKQAYTSKKALNRSIKYNSKCYNCSNKRGSKYADRYCIDCGKKITKFGEHKRCISCSQIKLNLDPKRRKKISDSCKGRIVSIKTRFLIKNNLIKYHENKRKKLYLDILNKKKYYREVCRITKQQNISVLENYNKRGRGYNKDIYHLDHIVSIIEGYRKQIDPKIIGNINNLRIICSIDNIKKGKEEQKKYGLQYTKIFV